jgi:SnoaL-like protein
MTDDDTMALVRGYHNAWTGGRYDEAIAVLSSELQVEVPINDYPTTESFAEALVRTAEMTSRVDLLSAMSAGGEAMLLYDMQLGGLGLMRVVEHFTTSDGKIVRLRQIHDTAALRAMGMGS